MPTLHRDYETRSAVDLRTAGVHKYAEDESTDVWCMSYAVDDEPVKLWVHGQPCPPEFVECARNPDWLAMAHNSAFEQTIERSLLSKRYGWPTIPLERERCTMAMAHAMAIAASLENAAAATGLEVRKDMDGRKLMMKMAQPRRISALGDKTYAEDHAIARSDWNLGTVLRDGRVIVWWGSANNVKRLGEYCVQDSEVERHLEKRLMRLIPAEQEFWTLDQVINNRGIRVDLPAIRNAMAVVELEKARMDKQMALVTNGAVNACSKAAALLEWVVAQGVEMDAAAKADIVAALSRDDLPDNVRKALLLRQEAARSSTAKLKAMLAGASADGRVRGTMQYHGAATGRMSGRRLMPHNFVRPTLLDYAEIEEVMDLLHGEEEMFA